MYSDVHNSLQQNIGWCEQDGKQTHIEEDINIIFEATTSSPRLMYNNQVKKKKYGGGACYNIILFF